MQLTQAQIAQFDRDGYLFFPICSPLRRSRACSTRCLISMPNTGQRTCARRAVRRCARTSRRMYSKQFAKLARHPRMVDPVMQIFGEPVYMHQFKINGKMAFEGDLWQWHQDYGTWQADDLMPEARAMNVAIFLDEVNEFNGPLMFIPGSHKVGVLDAAHDVSTTSYPLWTINHDTIRKLVERGGLVAPKGPPGSLIMFHSCLVHASTANLSPWMGQRLPEPVRGVESHSPLQTAGVHCAPRFHPNRVPARRLPTQGLRRAPALAGRHASGDCNPRSLASAALRRGALDGCEGGGKAGSASMPCAGRWSRRAAQPDMVLT